MARTKREEGEAFGSDSFLDIVANMVGILIVLVIIAGLRAGNAGDDTADQAALEAEVAALAEESRAIQSDVRGLVDEMDSIEEAEAMSEAERDSLALAVAAGERELAERRKTLDDQGRSQYDLNRAVAAAEDLLDRTNVELARALSVKPTATTKIETYPTPISRTVDGTEIHFQVKDGRIVFVPMDELVKLFENDAREKVQRLRDQLQVVESLGPIGGFRMTYTLERVEVPVMVNGTTGTMTKIWGGFTLHPLEDDLGETLEQAFKQDSEFRSILAERRARGATVTLWTYPDSFGAYRRLKKELYLAGYAVAGRPMPEGHPIGGSTSGSKSAAE